MVEVVDSTSGESSAKGNAFSGGANGYNLDMRSYQESRGQVSADTRLDATVNSGAVTSLTTKASGSYVQATAAGSTLTGVYTQATTAGSTVVGHSHIEAPDAAVGDLASQVQAVGNAQAFGLDNAAAGIRASQSNAATVTSDGGGIYGRVDGSANFSAVTAGNDVALNGAGGSAPRMIVDQNNTAALTQAGQFTAVGWAPEVTTSATAAGNNVNVASAGPLLDVTSRQANQAYVRAQTGASAFQYGTAVASAYGVGNALVAGDIGAEILLDTVQLNDGGGVEVIAQMDGTQGYDAQASATAYGNSAMGYACSDCQGAMNVSNSQTNNVDVGAESTVNVAAGQTARATANAVGNSATYFVSRPSGQ